ncbi:ABC transporter permease [Hujiaoplasma nucleasis]|uniref:ABC transporter permease n=1 Tax=Hujiaoplasma nucleasis TaxID=2725268 RepID=A0A7L6N2Z2_9MOLU|nr:FtsX-like permease family protein [Hujiaoplasma nucleasis]QLY39425.1 ABC transporter permease [Hujiaoplasma nucleasis]
MKLAFNIAKRFLLSAKKQTLVIILGIAVGVSVQVFIGALINGLQDNLIDTAIGSQSQITLTSSSDMGYISNYESLVRELKQRDDLTHVSPSVTSSGALSNNTLKENIVIKGVSFNDAEGIYKFKERLTDQSTIPLSNNQVLLGIGLKDLLEVNIGDSLSYVDNTDLSGTSYTLEVVGFVDFNSLDLNNSWMITGLSTSQNILGLNSNETQAIEIQIKDVFAADEISQSILSNLNNSSIQSVTWIERNGDLLSGLQGQSISSLMIQIFVIISVVLGISSVLAITVLQKSKQLGILKAMGIKDKDASKIFLFEGLLLGVFGAIIGILLGIGLLYAFDVFADTGIPITIDIGFLSMSAGIAIVASTIAALSPAIKSSKLSVIEVIRNG